MVFKPYRIELVQAEDPESVYEILDTILEKFAYSFSQA